jgi:hypothetical protein
MDKNMGAKRKQQEYNEKKPEKSTWIHNINFNNNCFITQLKLNV